MLDFRDQDLDDFKTDKEVQDAILMGLRYKELYEKLLWEKNILISCHHCLMILKIHYLPYGAWKMVK